MFWVESSVWVVTAKQKMLWMTCQMYNLVLIVSNSCERSTCRY